MKILKNLSKNLCVLGLGAIIVLVLAVGFVYLQNNSLSIKPSDVWNPSGEEWIARWHECKSIDCNSDLMKKNDASMGARNFLKLNPTGFLKEFQEMGKIDLGMVENPNMANSNGTYYLLNGYPIIVDTYISEEETNPCDTSCFFENC